MCPYARQIRDGCDALTRFLASWVNAADVNRVAAAVEAMMIVRTVDFSLLSGVPYHRRRGTMLARRAPSLPLISRNFDTVRGQAGFGAELA